MKHTTFSMEKFLEYCRRHPVSPIERLLLSSDGTVVRILQSLFLCPVRLETVYQHETVINDEESEWLEIPCQEKVIRRKAWLVVKGDASRQNQRKMLAISTFPVARLDPVFYQQLLLGEKPIGTIIQECRIPTYRDKFEICHLPLPEVARDLKLSEDALFWTRRYRLTLSDQCPGLISEVLSPTLSALL